MDKDKRSISYGAIVWEEMITWFNHTVECNSAFFIKKHEVGDLINFINDLKLQIEELQEKLENEKTNS